MLVPRAYATAPAQGQSSGASELLYEFVRREDLNRVLAPHRLKMAKVSRDVSVCPAGYGHFEGGKIVRIGGFARVGPSFMPARL